MWKNIKFILQFFLASRDLVCYDKKRETTNLGVMEMTSKDKDTLLLVGDADSARSSLHSILESSYYLLEAENATQGMLLLKQNARQIAAVVADLPLDNADQIRSLVETAQTVKDRQIPVILVIESGNTGSNEEYAFVLGAADVVLKPCAKLAVQRRVQVLVDLHQQQHDLEKVIDNQRDTIRTANQAVLDTLSSIIEYRGIESGNHVQRIRGFSKILLEALAGSFPEYQLEASTIDIISSAAVLHDIGKISIPDSVLNKPDKLTPDEFQTMRAHTTIGSEMVSGLNGLGDTDYLRYIYNITRYHHERWDGGGYPEGLAGDEIPICAQVVGLADAFDALTNQRSYKPAYAYDVAVNMILNGECGVFSPKLLECFKRSRQQMVELAEKHADGHPLKSNDIRMELPGPVPKTFALDALQLSQLKYHTLLHHMNDTVIEMDLDNRIYHVVYNPNPDFVTLLGNTTFEQLSERIIGEYVHPEDAQEVAAQYSNGMIQLFRQGSRKHSFRCRLFSPAHDEYRAYEITFQRLATGNANQRMVVVIFHALEGSKASPVPEKSLSLLESPILYDLNNAALCCICDEAMTLREGISSLGPLTGFSIDDIWYEFSNSFMEMVVPEDREYVASVMQQPDIRSSKVECQFRLRHKTGDPIWVLCRSRTQVADDGVEYRYHTLTDVTRLKESQLATEQALQRNQFAYEQTTTAVFDWDLTTDIFSCSDKIRQRFGFNVDGIRLSEALAGANPFHPDDLPLLRSKIQGLQDGKTTDVVDVRIANSDGRYCWSRIRATAVIGENGQPARLIGTVFDIDDLKSDALDMRKQAQRDELTKLLNKISTQSAITGYLNQREEDNLAAMMLLDLDNFKTVNDSLGHMYGDAVLTQVGVTLRNMFRSHDVVGRIGGDEFMILLKDLPNLDVIQDRSKRLVETMQNQLRQLMPNLPVSVSVGVAVAPRDGISFTELYRHSDEALYTAKGRGKNQYKIYSKHDTFNATENPTQRTTAIDSNDHPHMNDEALRTYVFQSLYESRDVESTINELLAFIGMRYNVSRVYIFENNEDNTHCSNTFEWCNQGINPEKDNLQNLSYETDIPNGQMTYDKDGLFYCVDTANLEPDIRKVVEPQGIRSMLHCAIMDQGVFRGFVGFDECTANCLWTPGQVSALRLLAEILAVFLTKQRALDLLNQN